MLRAPPDAVDRKARTQFRVADDFPGNEFVIYNTLYSAPYATRFYSILYVTG